MTKVFFKKSLFVLLFSMIGLFVFGQNIMLRGTVNDTKGEPLVGVTILVQGTTSGTVTDIDGNFTLSNVSPNAILDVSYVGMRTQIVSVNGQTNITIVMQEDTEQLEELVVVGYGTMKKSDVTGSIATAKAEDILRHSSFNALDGLKGKVSGVNIFSNSGQPGGPSRVIIRGIGTIKSSSNPLYVVDGVAMEDFQFLNPNDIESVEVLKDASSAAIYGARGANGVILITTKRGGRTNRPTLSYNGYLSVSTPATKMDVMNAAEFMEALKIANENHAKWWPDKPQSTFTPSDPRLFNPDGSPKYDTDWQDEATRTAFSHNHQLSIQQGGENSSVGAFLNYTDQQGVMLNTYMKRLNAKMTYDAKPLSWLSTGINILVNHTWQNDTDEGGGSQVPRRTMIEMPPFLPVKLDGKWTNSFTPSDPFKFEAMANPVHILQTTERLRLRTQIFGNAAFTFHLTPKLDLRTQIGVDGHLRKWKEYYPTDLINISAPRGRAFMSDTQILYWQEETYLTYNDTFGKSRLNAMLGLSWQERVESWSNMQTEGFSHNFFGYNNLAAATTPREPRSGHTRWALNSYFLRTAYSYADKYMATLTARLDGSSRFGAKNKYGFFPSVGLGWVVSEEDFMKNLSVIDYLKLHSSYGLTGNTEIGTYTSIATISSGTTLIDGVRAPISNPSRMANPNLKWEKTGQFDVGVNLILLKNRLNFDVSFYHKMTTDLLLERPIPHTTAYTSVMDNIGAVSNRGIDFLLTTQNVRTKDFRWTTTLNTNFNKNRIEKLGENDEDILPGPNWVSGSQTILRVGESLSSFYGYERLGVWTKEEAAEAAAAGRHVGEAKRSAEKKILGKGIPDWTGSFINTLNYRNFDFTLDLQFTAGLQILQQYYHSVEDRFGYTSGLKTILYEGYNGTNPNTMVQAIRNANLSGQNSEIDSRWVCDGSYLRGNLIQLGYTFNGNFLKNMNISYLRAYFNVNNAFVLHSKDFKGFDPEGTSQGDHQWGQNMFFFQYPKPRTFTFGLNLTF